MRKHKLTLAVVMVLGLGSAIALQAENTKAGPDRIAELISQLGSMKFAQRSQASKALDAIGLPALAALRRATTSQDMETRRRARELVARIEKRAEAAEALAPTRVHLVCKDMPITAAVALLAKQSKYDIQVHPNAKVKLAKRKITLDTGKVTFWEAYDQLCRKAGLVESSLPNGAIRFPAAVDQPVPFPIIQPPPPPPKQMPIKKAARNGRKGKPLQVKVAPQKPIAVAARVIQIQAQPALPVGGPAALPFVPGNGTLIDPFQQQNNGLMVLAEGKAETLPTRYCGAFRVRLKTKAVKDPKAGGRLLVELEVCAEPKMKNWSVIGSLKITQATDDREQNLTLVLEQRPQPEEALIGMARGGIMPAAIVMPQMMESVSLPSHSHRQSLHVRLKLGEKKAKVLKALAGSLTSELQTPPAALITVDKVLQAAGKTVKGAKGGSIQIIKAGKNQQGDYQIQFKLEKPPGVAAEMNPWGPMGNIRFAGMGGPVQVRIQIINGNVVQVVQMGGNNMPGDGSGSLSLVDAKGNHFVLTGSSGKVDKDSMEMTYTFRAGKGRFGDPEKFIYTASRKLIVDVPFAFKDVKLP